MPETVTDVTEAESSTYTSSNLARFAWQSDPLADEGLLHVEFQDGGRYIYLGVPKRIADELDERAYNPESYETTVGQYFHENVRNQFTQQGEEYQRLNR